VPDTSAHAITHAIGPDPSDSLTACPASTPADLLGRFRVFLRAEDGNLVAHGFGNQRITIPAASIGHIIQFRQIRGEGSPALLVLDHDGRMLLRATGRWDVNGEVAAICSALKLPRPEFDFRPIYRRSNKGNKRYRMRIPPKAPDYHRLHVVPRTTALLAILAFLFGLLCCGLAATAGVALIMLFPPSLGAFRSLLAIAAAFGGVIAAAWLVLRGIATFRYAMMWWYATRTAGSPAPAWRFFQYKKNRMWRSGLATLAIVASIPAVLITGPILGLVSLAHGFSDQALVSTLRQHGVRTLGIVMDDPNYDQMVAPQPDQAVVHTQLAFYRPGKVFTEVLDPGIGGQHWPINSQQIVTIVYNPANPDQAAVLGQITGSPWGGAPITNVIVGGILTLTLPFLVWALVARITQLRRRRLSGLLPLGP
jgi:hypothetical protein